LTIEQVASAATARSTLLQLIRFSVVGGLGLSIYLVCTILLMKFAAVSLFASASLAFALVVLVNYLLHYSWTFRSKRPHSSAALRFTITSIGGMAINGGFLALASRVVQRYTFLLLIAGALLVVVWNYLLARFWAFRNPGLRN